MKSANIIRALKNRAYRDTLSEDQRAQVGQHPSGIVELDDSVLGQVAGGSVVVPSVNHNCSGGGGGPIGSTHHTVICQF